MTTTSPVSSHEPSVVYAIAQEFNPESLLPLREELRAFYPDECHGDCKRPAIVQNYLDIETKMDEWLAEHPDPNIFTVKRQFYRTLAENFRPVIFRNSPFYFEGGANGGWWNHNPGMTWFRKNFSERLANAIPKARIDRFRARNANRFTLCCGFFTDEIHHVIPISVVLQQGLKGIWQHAQKAAKTAASRSEKLWFDAMLEGLEAIHHIQLSFAHEAKRLLADNALSPQQRLDLQRIADAASRAPWEPPQTFFEGLNTAWFLREILGLTDGLAVFSLGHPDAMLLKLYQDDLAAGRLTPAEAFRLVACWLLTAECHHDPMRTVAAYNDHEAEIPVTLGGCDRDGNEVFNDITRMVILAHRKLNLAFPKLHCRCSASSSDEYIRLLAQDIHNGRGVHTLFNDDITITTLMNAGKSLEDAREHICSGCWDTACDSRENRYGANYFSLARILEAMIYHDPELDRQVDFNFTPLDACTSYDELCNAVIDNISRFAASCLDDRTASESQSVHAYPHPLYSACLDGCIDSHRDEAVGGAKYNVTDLDMAFLGNVVDSLLAIRHICFDKRLCSLQELLANVRSNWTLNPALREAALKAPYWGDDSPASTDLARRLQTALYAITSSKRNGRGGPFVLCSWIYREYRFWGEKMRALPDGRHDGDYLAQALNPSSFRTSQPVTTTLNAISRLDHSLFDSSNINLTLERSTTSLEHIIALFRTFCQLKMHMLQPNCLSREDLLDAQLHPERHSNLIVKVCGFSARFIALSPEWQKAILDRHFF